MIEFIKSAYYLLSSLNQSKTLFDSVKGISTAKKPNTEVASRFIQLFEKHGIHSNQIPRLFGYGLTLADVTDHDKLLAKLTPEILQIACKLFAVRLEWLEGVDDILYETHDFYKQPEAYAEFLAQRTADNPHRITARLILSNDKSWEEDSLLILEEHFYLSELPVVRYYLCSGWIRRYWKSRADLTVCIAMTLKQRVHIKGWKTSAKIEDFCAGKGFINDLYDLPSAFERDWLFRRYIKDWHPDYWVDDPVAYLDGVDEGIFGKASALKRWLYYFDQGYLETGYSKENSRAKFVAELAKYQ